MITLICIVRVSSPHKSTATTKIFWQDLLKSVILCHPCCLTDFQYCVWKFHWDVRWSKAIMRISVLRPDIWQSNNSYMDNLPYLGTILELSILCGMWAESHTFYITCDIECPLLLSRDVLFICTTWEYWTLPALLETEWISLSVREILSVIHTMRINLIISTWDKLCDPF